MEATPTSGSKDRPNHGAYHVRLVPDEGMRFRFVRKTGESQGDWSGTVMWVGDNGDTRIPAGVAMHLPYQGNKDLLNRTFPPDPDLPRLRSDGGYLLHLVTEEGSVAATGGYFEEFRPSVPVTAQPEV